jgi:hypothetical protein
MKIVITPQDIPCLIEAGCIRDFWIDESYEMITAISSRPAQSDPRPLEVFARMFSVNLFNFFDDPDEEPFISGSDPSLTRLQSAYEVIAKEAQSSLEKLSNHEQLAIADALSKR